ncbi:MAG: serine hydrolase domain-containing protein [Pseudohongiellaceae bacterium]
MSKKYLLAVIVLNLLFTGQAIAQDSYNVATEVLYIPVVKVGNDFYRDVEVTVSTKDVVSVGKVTGLNAYDTYDNGQLAMSSVLVGSTTYTNVVVNVGADKVRKATLSVKNPNLLSQSIEFFIPAYLNKNGITAATLTIMKDNVVLYEKAFGYKDAAKTTPLLKDALLTGASIVKPVTGAAIQKLIAAGKVAIDDKVFCSSGRTPSTSTSNVNKCWVDSTWVASKDARIQTITVGQLLSHQGGWNRQLLNCYAYKIADAGTRATLVERGDPCEPLQHEAIIQAALGLLTPPTLEQDIKFFMQSDLDFTPGSAPASGAGYSNFGYMLLGLIVEKASGISYTTYVNDYIFTPIGVTSNSFKAASSLLKNADPREPNYVTNMLGYSLYEPGKVVSIRDGAVNSTNFLAAATSIMTSKAMATFAGMYKIDTNNAFGHDGINNGKPLDGLTNIGSHDGDLPGTNAVVVQLASGTSYAMLMNKNALFEGGSIKYTDYITTTLNSLIKNAGY